MSRLTELRAALDKRGTRMPITCTVGARPALIVAVNDLAALLDVAEAAEELNIGGTFPKLADALAPLVKGEQAMPCHDVSTSQGTPCVNEDDHE